MNASFFFGLLALICLIFFVPLLFRAVLNWIWQNILGR
jgi:hypothetical protein